jgi:UDP-N-acetylglucosamine transferase subunit ALG13
MILVTVGNHSQPFDRLVRTMDELASQLGEKVVIQRGCSNFVPRFAEHFQWATTLRMEQLTEEARVVVGHAGSGTILVSLQKGKPLVIVPRLKQYGEHYDDHQLQLAGAMEARGRVILVHDPTIGRMQEAIRTAAQKNIPGDGSGVEKPLQLINALKRQLDSWDGKEGARIRRTK